MHVTVKGLVIRETDFGESDRYITLLTEDRGKIEVLCRGVRRRSGKNTAAVRLFCFSELTLYESRGRYTVNEAETIAQFWGITEDIEKYALCCYFAQISDMASDADDTMPELLPMFLYALRALDKNRPLSIVKAAFELRLLAQMGFTPDLSGCSVCQKERTLDGASFLLENGILVCADCRRRIGGRYFPVPGGVLDAMRYIVSCEVKKLFSFALGEETAALLSQICEAYLLFHAEKNFSALDFYKSLFTELKI